MRASPPRNFAKTVLRCELSSGTFVTPQGRVADNVKIQLSVDNLRTSPAVPCGRAVDGVAEPRLDIVGLPDPSNIDDWLTAEHVPIVAKTLHAVLGRRGAN